MNLIVCKIGSGRKKHLGWTYKINPIHGEALCGIRGLIKKMKGKHDCQICHRKDWRKERK